MRVGGFTSVLTTGNVYIGADSFVTPTTGTGALFAGTTVLNGTLYVSGAVSMQSSAALDGGTPRTHGLTVPAATPSVTTSCLYSPDGIALWYNGAQLATGASISGTIGRLSKFTAANALGDSVLAEATGVITFTTTVSGPQFVMSGNGGTGLSPSIALTDTNQATPAGRYVLSTSGDAFIVNRGVLGISAVAKVTINNTGATFANTVAITGGSTDGYQLTLTGGAGTTPHIGFTDTSQVSPAGRWAIGVESDTCVVQRGVLGVSASPKLIVSDTGAVMSGTLAIGSDFAINTSKFTVAGSSGNTVIAGTLVTGSGAVALTGATGKIVAIDSTRFASLSGANLTGIPTSAVSSGNFVATVASGTGITSSVTSGNAAATAISLNNTAVSPATYGSSTQIPVLAIDQQGRITGASTVSVSVSGATSVAITDDTTTNATMYPTWVTTTTGNLPVKVSSTGVRWNPSSGAFTVSGSVGTANALGSGTGAYFGLSTQINLAYYTGVLYTGSISMNDTTVQFSTPSLYAFGPGTSTTSGFAPNTLTNVIIASGATDKLAGYFEMQSAVNQSGGPQALEGFINMTQTGTTTLAIGVIGNVVLASSGTTTTMRSVQGGVEWKTSSGGGTDAIAFHAAMTGRSSGSGTYTNAVAFNVGTFGAGITTKYSLRSTDATAAMSHAGPVLVGDGSVTAASVGFSSEPNTGIYRVGSTVIGVTVNSTKIFAASSSGVTSYGTMNVATSLGVGILTAAGTPLEVSTTAAGSVALAGYFTPSMSNGQQNYVLYGMDSGGSHAFYQVFNYDSTSANRYLGWQDTSVGVGATSMRLYADGGFAMGSPTGLSKGAGTINVATGVYLNGTAYTNPDFVFEHWATGKISRFAVNVDRMGIAYHGLPDLADVEAHARAHYQLPLMAKRPDRDLFLGGELLMATVEQAYLYLFQQRQQIAQLTQRLAHLESA